MTLYEINKLVSSYKNEVFASNKAISIQCLETGEKLTKRSLHQTVSYLKEKGINTTPKKSYS
jgi:hypothetical protein